MEPTSTSTTHEAAILASACASAPLASLGAMRKNPPRFAGVELPSHFLKHADEQTILALEAVRLAVDKFALDPREQTNWGILAAPRFMGRMPGANILTRFAEKGGSSVTPHALAQYSLHSVSGAASIALGIHGPNVGLGGGPGAIGDALTAALTLFDSARCPALWLLLTQWDPEPIPDGQGLASNLPVCHAVALVIRPGVTGQSHLRLSLPAGRVLDRSLPEPTVPEIARGVQEAHAGKPAHWTCRLPWGATAEMRLAAAAGALRKAA